MSPMALASGMHHEYGVCVTIIAFLNAGSAIQMLDPLSVWPSTLHVQNTSIRRPTASLRGLCPTDAKL